MDFNTIDIIFMFLKGFFLEQTPVDRAKTALSVTTDTALAKALGLSQSVVGGYNRRQTVPLEQCIKIAERTGVSLDWLILGKGEMAGGRPSESAAPPPDVQMLLTGWQGLSTEAKGEVLALVLAKLQK